MADKTPKEILNELKALAHTIREMEKATTYDVYGDCSGLNTDGADPDSVEMEYGLAGIMEHLYQARMGIERLSSPVQYESRLYKNSAGKYEDNHGKLYSCGSAIEFFDKGDPDCGARARWIISRVEHDGNNYYIVGYRHLPLDRALTRVRRV